MLIGVSKGCQEVRLVFDQYTTQSLKSRTRSKTISGNKVKYKISDTSDIINISLKQLSVHIETKQGLTEHLAKHTRTAMQREGIGFSITYAKITETNIPTMSLELMNHDHEETDTLLVLYALDVAKDNPFKECIVLSTDTDVSLLLIYYYQSLPHLTYF